MSNVKQLALALIIGLGIGYFVGFKSTPEGTTKIVQEDKKKTTSKVTKTVTIKKPDGTIEKTKTTSSRTNTVGTTKSSEKSVDGSTRRVRLEMLAKTTTVGMELDYGLGVSTNLYGPIVGGVQGYRSGNIGVSLGLEF